ncbi:MAG: 3-mercaptopyruvate sulfurtransferase [Hyphomicrobiaceae bacterium]
MQDHRSRWLVETDWLAANLAAPDVVVVDGSWHMPATGRKARTEHSEQRIPGAVFFDIDEIRDENSALPHMLPSTVKFSSRMRKLGIGDGARIVVYDSIGLYSAPRVWWMLRAMGKDDVAVLNGGLPKWLAEGRPIKDGPPRARIEKHFTARLNRELLRERDDIVQALSSGTEQIADARSSGRFEGREPEPWPGLRSGHMPQARSVPFTELVAADGTLKPNDDLRRIFSERGLDLTRPIITTCGSGVTAAIDLLALAVLGHQQTALYDGSWSDWGADPSLPIATGPA